MSAVWTITYDDGSGAVEKAAADWGLNSQPVIRTRDRSATLFSFRMAGAAPEGGIPFPFKAKVIIKQNRTYAAGAWSGTGYIFTGYQTTQKGEWRLHKAQNFLTQPFTTRRVRQGLE